MFGEYKFYYIYEITDTINGKTYIGQHRTDDLNDGYMGSGNIVRAIKKRRPNTLSKKILEECTADNIDEREVYWISYYKSIGKAEYNIAKGGSSTNLGCTFAYMSDTEKEKIFRKRDKEPLLIIMETEKTFTSVLDCAEYLNCAPTTVSRNLNKILSWCVGYHLCYFKEYNRENNPYLGLPRFNNKPVLKKDTFSVIIMETEEPFRTIKECADFIGVNRSGVNKVLSGESKNTGGYHICYFKDYNRENNPWLGKDRYSEKKKKTLKDKYFVEELNKTFKSYQEIADYLKVDRVTVYNLMIGKKTRLKNLTIRKI